MNKNAILSARTKIKYYFSGFSSQIKAQCVKNLLIYNNLKILFVVAVSNVIGSLEGKKVLLWQNRACRMADYKNCGSYTRYCFKN